MSSTLPVAPVGGVVTLPAAAVPAETPLSITAATLAQLLKQAGADAVADAKAEPGKITTFVKGIPSDVAAVNWPLVIIAVIAFAALVLHIPKVMGLL